MKSNKNIEILTPNGFQHFSGIRKLKKREYLKLYLSNDQEVICSINHVWISNAEKKVAHQLEVFDELDSIGDASVTINDITHHTTTINIVVFTL